MFGGAATFLTPLSFHIPQILGIIGADLPCGPYFYQIQDRKKMVFCLARPIDLHGALRRGKGLEMDRKLQWSFNIQKHQVFTPPAIHYSKSTHSIQTDNQHRQVRRFYQHSDNREPARA